MHSVQLSQRLRIQYEMNLKTFMHCFEQFLIYVKKMTLGLFYKQVGR